VTRLVILGALAAAGGCILPVSTGTPLPATTVGTGHLGGSISGEAPTLDLLAEGNNYADLRGAAPAAAMTMTLAYGVRDDTDLELAGEGALYYFLVPLPSGGSIGIRHHLLASDVFDIGIAAKVGSVSSDLESNSTDSSASAVYGGVQGIVQVKNGWIRPMVALNAMPFRIQRHPSNEAEYRFRGLASSLTVGLMLTFDHVQLGPYFTITNFESERFSGAWFPTGGLMFAVRPDRNRPHPLVIPGTPSSSPGAPIAPP
jgi:hypothetical protein